MLREKEMTNGPKRLSDWIRITLAASKTHYQELPCDLMVKNPPCQAGDIGLSPGLGTMTPYTWRQLSKLWLWSPQAATREKPAHGDERSCEMQPRPSVDKNKYENKAKKYIARLTPRDLIPMVCTGICEAVAYFFSLLCIHHGTITEPPFSSLVLPGVLGRCCC